MSEVVDNIAEIPEAIDNNSNIPGDMDDNSNIPDGCSTSTSPTTGLARLQDRKKERIKLRRARKLARREKRPCCWEIYGCTELVLNQIQLTGTHETTCNFIGDDYVRRCWERLKQHESDHNITKNNSIWRYFSTVARGFTMPTIYTTENTDAIVCTEGPVVFPSSLCWTNAGQPSNGDLFEFALTESTITGSAVKLPKDANSLCILRQLVFADHRPNTAQGILNCLPADLLKRYPFIIPEWLMKRYIDPVGDITVDATPLFVIDDIHSNRGMSVVCSHMEGCEKMWLFWPPTAHNNAIFYSAFENSLPLGTKCFQKIGTLLEGGQIVITDSKHAIFIPPGWISFAYTIAGGFVVGNVFAAREDLLMFLLCVEQELKVARNTRGHQNHITFFTNLIGESLRSPDERVVHKAADIWIRLVAAMQETSSRGLVWAPVVRSNMITIVENLADHHSIELDGDCPCGMDNSGGKAFYMHFTMHVPARL